MKATLIFLFGLLLFSGSFGQDKLNTLQRAMRDEMERNMKELHAEGFDRPFFINYTIQDVTIYNISATRGALISSQESKDRRALSIRMLVGDYEFNDESLDNNLFSPPQANAISFPLDDDYLGIRRSLWVSTDNVYRNASRQFAKNKEMLKEQGKPLAELPHRSFAKVPPSKIDIEGPTSKFDKAAAEEYVRKVSAVVNEFKDIESSIVNLSYTTGYRYLVNSEGSINRIPDNLLQLVVLCRFRGPNGEMLSDYFSKYSSTAELPSLDQAIEETRRLCKDLIQMPSVPSVDEEYIGPVLFEGMKAASMIYGGLFINETGLFADNEIQRLRGPRFDGGTPGSSEQQIGKQVFAKSMTVKAIPKTTKFGEVDLRGSFVVDSEGTVPADETVLVENGVLKQLCNDRTLTKSDQTANGLADGPGVLSVTFQTGVPLASMKTKLIEQAKKEGLDYALKVKHNRTNLLASIYKVYVADGREELVTGLTIEALSQRAFRRILETSNEMGAYDLRSGESAVSIICPEAVLFEEVQCNVLPKRSSEKEVDYVPSPLKK